MAEQKPRVQIKFEHYTRTKQAFKDECNINNIVGQFMRTGQTAHVNSTPPQYGFHTGLDFRESLELITDAQSQFDSLPAKIRARFANDPAQYLDFATDSANLPEMREMGLALPKSGDPEWTLLRPFQRPLKPRRKAYHSRQKRRKSRYSYLMAISTRWSLLHDSAITVPPPTLQPISLERLTMRNDPKWVKNARNACSPKQLQKPTNGT